jgi:hypothetical protein
VFQSLKSESDKACGRLSELQSKLMEVEGSRRRAEEQLREVAVENTKLKMDLAAAKQSGRLSLTPSSSLFLFSPSYYHVPPLPSSLSMPH